MKLPKWAIPAAGAVVALGGGWFFLRGRDGFALVSEDEVIGAACAAFGGDPKAMQAAINAALAKASPSTVQPANWMWVPPATATKPGQLTVDGRPGPMSCRAAEWLIANKLGNAEIALFAQSTLCGCGKKRAPCGVAGPTASQAVKDQIVAAAVAKGYPAADVTKAFQRESGWRPMGLYCAPPDKHPVAGGLGGMLNSTLTTNGFQGGSDQFAALTAEEQLPFVLKFIGRMPKSCLGKKGDFGLALFTPAYVCKPDEYVIAEPNTLVWQQNPGLRTPGGGPITAGSVRATG